MQIRPILAAAIVILIVLAAADGSTRTSATGPDNVVTEVDPNGVDSSLTLDANGYPVVAYSDFFDNNLKILHCDDPLCIGVESITSPDSGFFPSLVLDDQGFPVVSYLGDSGFLKVMHCNDPNCSGADESIASVDAIGGLFTPSEPSLRLDALGYPVVTYQGLTSGDLRVLHCNDPDCVGGDESITSPDPCCESADSSLRLDSSGNPVISYRADGLKIMHCNDPNCSGGDETFASPDSALGGAGTSLALDASGRPVVSYLAEGGWPPKLLHCGDVDCAAGNSINALEPSSNDMFVNRTRLMLDSAGHPVIYYVVGFGHPSSSTLRLAHCDDSECAGGDEAITAVRNLFGGGFGSFVLDAAGNPVISVTEGSTFSPSINLLLIYCGDANCGFKPATPTPPPVGGVPLDAELRALPAATAQSSESGSGTPIVAAAVLGAALLAGVAWYGRRRARRLRCP